MLITPFGNPALAESSANLSAVSGVTYKMMELIDQCYVQEYKIKIYVLGIMF